ncbi:MAG: ATP-binding protein [Candidatus Thorarchaeota archaeon]
MKTDLRVLSIEDSEDDVILLERTLKKGGFEPVIKQVANETELRAALLESWDIVICDYLMPEFEAHKALHIIREVDPDMPLIIVSGTISDQAAVSMMRAGAQDYILKENLSRLVPAIRRELEETLLKKQKRLGDIALKNSENRHRMLVESMSDTIFVLDAKGYVTEYYSKASLKPNTEPTEMLGKHVGDIFESGTASVFMSIIQRVLDQKQTILFDYMANLTGIRKWHSANLSPHEDNEHIVVVVRDITDLKLAEEQLRASNHMATLYLDIMGHDIRNYLQAITISADLLDQSQESSRNHHFIERISESVQKCEQLISNISLTAELPFMPLSSHCLCSVVKECIAEFKSRNENINIHLNCEIDKALINADKFLSNLVSNLLDNTVDHGQGKTSDIWIDIQMKSRGFELSIADNGPGIPDKQKESLFDAERRFGGVGIHQAKQIVTKYGGRIDVKNRIPDEPSNGAKFLIWFPQAELT